MPIEKQPLTFISYSRADKDFALGLAKELRSSGFHIWLDQLDIPTGSRWDDEIEKALSQCDIFMVILTPHSISSNNVKDEIGYAIDSNKRIMPVLLENANVPFRVRRFQYVDFTGKSREEGIEAAKQLLRNLLSEPAASDVSASADWQSDEARPVAAGTSAQSVQQAALVKDSRTPPFPDQFHLEIENPNPEVRLKAVEQLARLLNSQNLGLARSAREALERLEKEDDSRTVSHAALQALEGIRRVEKSALPIVTEEPLRAARTERITAPKRLAEETPQGQSGNSVARTQSGVQGQPAPQTVQNQPKIMPSNKSPLAALLLSSILFGGAGQIYLGQWKKGLALIIAFVLGQCFFAFVPFWIYGAIDAYAIADKLNKGYSVGEWEFGFNWIGVIIAVPLILILLAIYIYVIYAYSGTYSVQVTTPISLFVPPSSNFAWL